MTITLGESTKARIRKKASMTADIQKFTCTIPVELEKIDYLNRLLDLYAAHDPSAYKFAEAIDWDGSDEYLFYEQVRFPTGYSATILIRRPDETTNLLLAEATLYDAKGIKQYYWDKTTQLADEWVLYDERNGYNEYTVNIVEEKRFVDQSPLGKQLSKLRNSIFQSIEIPEECSRNKFFKVRGKYYACQTKKMPKALDTIVEKLAQHDPSHPSVQVAGNYLYTGHMDYEPFPADKEEVQKLMPALRDFSKKMQFVQGVYQTTPPEALKKNSIPPDIVMYLDALSELKAAVPRFFQDSLELHTDFLQFRFSEYRSSYEGAKAVIDALRGRLRRKGDGTLMFACTTLAEKMMREVYSEHKDTVDYDKLNQETVARLIEKDADDKAVHEVAELARWLNPSILDTKAYAQDLIAQAKRSCEVT